MSKKDSSVLFRRSDGFFEDGKNNFAVVMLSKTGTVGKLSYLNYQTSFRSGITRLEYDPSQKIAFFPQQVVEYVVSSKLGRLPTEEEVNELFKVHDDEAKDGAGDPSASGDGTTAGAQSPAASGPGTPSAPQGGQPVAKATAPSPAQPAADGANAGPKIGVPVAKESDAAASGSDAKKDATPAAKKDDGAGNK